MPISTHMHATLRMDATPPFKGFQIKTGDNKSTFIPINLNSKSKCKPGRVSGAGYKL